MKRQSAKGRGKDIFFEEPTAERQASEASEQRDRSRAQQQEGTPSQRRDVAPLGQPTVKVTLWLPQELAEQLDQEWLQIRARDRKATKSGLVTRALRDYFADRA